MDFNVYDDVVPENEQRREVSSFFFRFIPLFLFYVSFF